MITAEELETLARNVRRAVNGDVDLSLPLLADKLANEVTEWVARACARITDLEQANEDWRGAAIDMRDNWERNLTVPMSRLMRLLDPSQAPMLESGPVSRA